MVDTVRFLGRWKLLSETIQDLQANGFCQRQGWYLESHRRRPNQGTNPTRETPEPYFTLAGYDELSGMRIKGRDYLIETAEVSLPRLRFGYNGRLITNPFELQKAWMKAFNLLDAISIPEESLIEISRVDLVLNLPCDPRERILIHRNARHPWIRRTSWSFDGTGINFPGKDYTIQLYSKGKERADKSGFNLPELPHSLRVEVQCKNVEAVRRLLGYDEAVPVTSLDFFHCYRKFRYALSRFDQISEPDEACTLLNLIAECEIQGFRTSFGMSALEWQCLKGNTKATMSRMRSSIQKRIQSIKLFKWADVLPPYTLPEPVVDIYPGGREELLTGIWTPEVMERNTYENTKTP